MAVYQIGPGYYGIDARGIDENECRKASRRIDRAFAKARALDIGSLKIRTLADQAQEKTKPADPAP